jgi:hypothetical protein
MAIYCYTVLDEDGSPTGETIEHICKHSNRPEYIVSSTGRKAVYDIKYNVPARMSEQWAGAAGTLGGVNGFYDKGAGRRFQSRTQQDKWLDSNNLVRASDLPTHWIEDKIEKQDREDAFHDKVSETYQENLTKYNGDAVKAATETWENPSITQLEGDIHGS